MQGDDCTIGVDVGTTAVKAVAVDARGQVLARTRVPHTVSTPTADHLEHDAARAWRRGPRRAFAEVSAALEGPAAGVVVTSMVPSITAVNRRGVPQVPGLLYGDVRARRRDLGSRRLRGRAGSGHADAHLGGRPHARCFRVLALSSRGQQRALRRAGRRHGDGHLLRRAVRPGAVGPRVHSPSSASRSDSCLSSPRSVSRPARSPGVPPRSAVVRSTPSVSRWWPERTAPATCSPSSARP